MTQVEMSVHQIPGYRMEEDGFLRNPCPIPPVATNPWLTPYALGRGPADSVLANGFHQNGPKTLGRNIPWGEQERMSGSSGLHHPGQELAERKHQHGFVDGSEQLVH